MSPLPLTKKIIFMKLRKVMCSHSKRTQESNCVLGCFTYTEDKYNFSPFLKLEVQDQSAGSFSVC